MPAIPATQEASAGKWQSEEALGEAEERQLGEPGEADVNPHARARLDQF